MKHQDSSVATQVFGERLVLAEKFADLLAGPAITRGFIGPKEKLQLWDRHILNSVAIDSYVPENTTVADVGSGAGLPGIPLAIARPDVSVVLIEPMRKRVNFLEEVIETLGLSNASTICERAEDVVGERAFPVVTARAVAPLKKLSIWTLPMLEPHGKLLALKGKSAPEEVKKATGIMKRLGALSWRVDEVTVPSPTFVVVVHVGPK